MLSLFRKYELIGKLSVELHDSDWHWATLTYYFFKSERGFRKVKVLTETFRNTRIDIAKSYQQNTGAYVNVVFPFLHRKDVIDQIETFDDPDFGEELPENVIRFIPKVAS